MSPGQGHVESRQPLHPPRLEHGVQCRRLEKDGVVVLIPVDRTDRQNAHTLLWLAGLVDRGS